MRILVDITDREILDLDLAVTERRIKLQEQLKAASAGQLDRIKDGDVAASKAFHAEAKKVQDELNSLNSVMDKLYVELNKNVMRRALGGND